MDTHLLEEIGLTSSQARAYYALVAHGICSAPTIAPIIKESRSNTYKILDKLCSLGLAAKNQKGNRITYAAANPVALEQLLRKKAAQLDLQERRFNAALPSMLDFFFTHSEKPGIRFFEGKEGMKQIYSEMLQTGETLYLLRSPDDVRFYDETFFAELRKKRRLLGIKTVAITPDVPSANHDPKIDKQNNLVRTWIPAKDYTAQVEWNVAGSKVALLSFGKEAMGILIESEQIAESFRQLLRLTAASISNRRKTTPLQ